MSENEKLKSTPISQSGILNYFTPTEILLHILPEAHLDVEPKLGTLKAGFKVCSDDHGVHQFIHAARPVYTDEDGRMERGNLWSMLGLWQRIHGVLASIDRRAMHASYKAVF